MRKSRIVLPVAALCAASLLTLSGPVQADPPTPLDAATEQARPESVETVLATLDRITADPLLRPLAKAKFTERLVLASAEAYPKASAEAQKALLNQVLTRLDGWSADEGVALADDFLMQLARAIRENGRAEEALAPYNLNLSRMLTHPDDALALYTLKIDRMMARPIGTSLDDFYATVGEARALAKKNSALRAALISKGMQYIAPKGNDSTSQKQRIDSIVILSNGDDEKTLSRRKTTLAADALRNFGEALVRDNLPSDARTAFFTEYLMRKYGWINKAMPDEDVAALADNCRRLVDAWKNSSVKSAAQDYAKERVEWSEKLAKRRPTDPDAQIQYGWALRDLARRGNLLDQAVSLQKLGPLVAELLERHGDIPAASRLAVAYYDDSGNNAADNAFELAEHRRALAIAQAAQQRFGDEAQMLEPITIIAMNLADAFKRAGRNDEMLHYYRIARTASDADIIANPDDLDTINRRLKLLAHEASLADEFGDPHLAFEAADARFQLASELGKRGYMVDKVLPHAEQSRNTMRAKLDNVIRARAEERLRLSPAPAAKLALPPPPGLASALPVSAK